MYVPSLYYYGRRKTHEVKVGEVGVGASNPIRVQSMTIADTLNTQAVVAEAESLVKVGCEIVRITAPTIKHAENLKNIRDELRRRGIKVPLVADIHFTPNAAEIAADYVEKVRVNPGNYADRKLFVERDYTDAEYEEELARIRDKFLPLVRKCKSRGVAMRIGTNHGSLSDRIMNRYGDTPLGMVESALEFLRICEDENYRQIILSMKASNTQVMVQAYRLLVDRMNELGWTYPVHLGVTEAGDGVDGRIKSAIGILTLLQDGIGDTIRVSLTEDSIYEIPVAQSLVRPFNQILTRSSEGLSQAGASRGDLHGAGRDGSLPRSRQAGPRLSVPASTHEGPAASAMACERPSEDLVSTSLPFDPLQHVRRAAETVGVGPCWVGGKHSVRVQVDLQGGEIPWVELEKLLQEERVPEIVSVVIRDAQRLEKNLSLFATFRKRFPKLALAIDLGDQGVLFPQVVPMVDKVSVCPDRTLNEEGWKNQALEILRVAKLWPASLEWKVDENVETLVELAKLAKLEQVPVHLCWQGSDVLHHNRYLAARLKQENLYTPLRLSSPKISQQDHLLLCGELGSLLIDGLGDIISIPLADPHAAVHLAYNLLQGCRVRLSKTEFIACPSCGRTQFDLQTTTQKVKANTSHLKGVKIAIMGCIVNGPGEMADADFGYVGGGPGRIHLYVGKECVEKNLPSEVAVEKLIDLIKAHGKWVEPIQVTA